MVNLICKVDVRKVFRCPNGCPSRRVLLVHLSATFNVYSGNPNRHEKQLTINLGRPIFLTLDSKFQSQVLWNYFIGSFYLP